MISSIPVSNCLWNVIYRKRMSILHLSPCTIQVGWTIWSENVTLHKIWFAVQYTYHAFPVFLRNIHIVHDTYCTSKTSSTEIPRQKPVEKDQHKERCNPRKYHMYQKMISKCKFHMGHNPWNINYFAKKCFGRQTIPP